LATLATPLVEFRKNGIYCSQADIYIDPWQPVEKAVITHAHSDHARWGHKYYLSHIHSASVLKIRLGADINLQTIPYHEPVHLNGVKLTLHPAGHIYGSAQVRLEYKGEVWVISGDYKTENDYISAPFEPVPCHVFISESTFGLPIYKWKPQHEVFTEINSWWRQNQEQGQTSVIFGYSLGKAQRIIKNIDHSIGPVFVHGAIYNCNEALIKDGALLPSLDKAGIENEKNIYNKSLIIAPPSALGSPWMKKFYPYRTAITSGWMNLRGAKRRRAIDRGFILSDHADWPALLSVIESVGAEKIYVTHGYTASFSRYLKEKGYWSAEVQTQFEGELSEIQEAFSDTSN
jgi:putative mRNA 3-end processing factor